MVSNPRAASFTDLDVLCHLSLKVSAIRLCFAHFQRSREVRGGRRPVGAGVAAQTGEPVLKAAPAEGDLTSLRAQEWRDGNADFGDTWWAPRIPRRDHQEGWGGRWW